MYTDIRYGSFSQSLNRETLASHQTQDQKKIDQFNCSSQSPLQSEEGETATETLSENSSVVSEKGQRPELFLGREIEQVEPSSFACDLLKAGYRSSNRTAVSFGLAGGIVGGIHGGPGGASFGMSVGSTFGANLGGVIGIVEKCSTLTHTHGIEEESLEQDFQDVTQSDHFLDHAVQVVDHAGHQASIGSIGVGLAVLIGSLATGAPLIAAFHTAGVYSGAAWAFGLTTGSAHWTLRHLQESEHRAAVEQQLSSGDIELSPLKSVNHNDTEESFENRDI